MEDRFNYKVVVKNTSYYVDRIDYAHEMIYYDTILRILSISFKDAKLIQCTGLKDKNGEFIYEGDIVKTKDKLKLCVKYNSETFNLSFWEYFNKHYFEVGHLDSKDQCELYELEIIGNIYENPELIEGDKE